jgi:hypothetical protein
MGSTKVHSSLEVRRKAGIVDTVRDQKRIVAVPSTGRQEKFPNRTPFSGAPVTGSFAVA